MNGILELDFYIPELKLGFEYQGQQHYSDQIIFGNIETRQLKDNEKRNLCQKAQIYLIEIPYWWNKRKESLVRTIHDHRPDLIKIENQKEYQPIPPNPISANKFW